jgi:uncharacterized protein YbjT (DUF2867 family)
MTVLVAGATGNVGRPLVDHLLADGQEVRALTRDPARATFPAGVEAVSGNLADAASLAGVFDGVTAMHLITFDAADYSPLANGPEIVELAVKAGVRRCTVLMGDVERSPLEHAVDDGGLEWTFLAPAEFMSNTLEWADSIRDEGVVREGFATMPSSKVHDADIAAVAAVALTRDGHARREYALTGPQALTPPEQVQVISETLGREVRFVELTRDEVVAGWRAAGFSDEEVEYFLMVRTAPPEAGRTVQPTVPDVTGRPARSLADWVRENAAAFGG